MSREPPFEPPLSPPGEGWESIEKGYQPLPTPLGESDVQGGYQPTTSEGDSAPATPPTQDSGGKK
jgi:hypothetical protein